MHKGARTQQLLCHTGMSRPWRTPTRQHRLGIAPSLVHLIRPDCLFAPGSAGGQISSDAEAVERGELFELVVGQMTPPEVDEAVWILLQALKDQEGLGSAGERARP